MSLNTFSQIVLDTKYAGFIKNKAGLNGFISRHISKSKIDAASSVSFNEIELNAKLKILYFELTIVKIGNEPLTFINSLDGQLSKEMKAALKTVTPGNKIYIERIKATTTDDHVYSLYATDYIVD